MHKTIAALTLVASLIAVPAQASVIYDFVTTSHEHTRSIETLQITLSDEAAAQASITFRQRGGIGTGAFQQIGTGVENVVLLGQGFVGFQMPTTQFNMDVRLDLTLLDGELGGRFRYNWDVGLVDISYDQATGTWRGAYGTDNTLCYGGTDNALCAIEGYFVRQEVPEPAGLVLLALPLLFLLRRHHGYSIAYL